MLILLFIAVIVTPEPCNPSPCGPYGECRTVNSQAVCSCLPGYFGNPCRPECTVSSDCPLSKNCVNQKCRDPCAGACGIGAECMVKDHNPICSCPGGTQGNPFVSCNQPVVVEPVTPTPVVVNPCSPSPCGPGAECRKQGNNAVCFCPKNYVGEPTVGCRPECVQNSDCPRDKGCVNNRCVNPCPGVCGLNAECRVVNHAPVCSCLPNYTGDPSSSCRVIPATPEITTPVVVDGCSPSPCGPNSVCRNMNGQAVCSCQPSYFGVPPNCRPECVSNGECSQSQSCVSQRCVNPCPGVCGRDAECRVVNHNPICSCRKDYTGDPFRQCLPVPVVPKEPDVPLNPCIPSPCGPNSQCQVIGNEAKCACQAGMVGSVPNCRPECVVNSDCSSNLACVGQRCKDPCPGSCGSNAQCRVIGHNPVCVCQVQYTGDPYRACFPVQRKYSLGYLVGC